MAFKLFSGTGKTELTREPSLPNNDFPLPGKRIAVIGVTGSGKTTLSANLAKILNLTHIELDGLHWEKDWTYPSDEIFRERVARAIQAPGWVTDGNYSVVRGIIWSQADTVIWLDFALLTCLWRLIRRSIKRVGSKQELWNGNRETVRGLLFSKNSLFGWLFKTHPERRRDYPRLLSRQEFSHLRVIRLRSPRQTNELLHSLISSNTTG
jgi:adenylate kinase family enzyme